MNDQSTHIASVERQAANAFFSKAQLPHDTTLIVHSAFSSLSRAGFRAEKLIEAFIEQLPQANLLMPTMSWRTVNAEQPVFDVCTTASHTGILTEIFRRNYATYRSLHPTHSVAGIGTDVAALLSRHQLPGDDGQLTPCSVNSPYGILFNEFSDRPVYILLLGVGLESCTAIHHPEEVVAAELYLRAKTESETLQLRRADGSILTVLNRRHQQLPRDFNQFLPALEQTGQLLYDTIANTRWMLFSLHTLLNKVFAECVHFPGATLKKSNN